MPNKLQQYFPMLRTRNEVLEIIRSREELQKVFQSWNEEQREEFLNICAGMWGRKILYDFMFKEILNPETVPERLESLLSCILRQEVHIVEVLPNDNTRIADENALLITDIVVRLADQSIGNVEIQKIGYAFPGQRSACYSADLLLRQYKRVRDAKKQRFNYRDVRPVYTIVFFDQSPGEFRAFPQEYLHRFQQVSDTGLKLELLQKFYFVPLDIFREIYKNKSIGNKLEAWLWFFSMDEPEEIIRLIEAYPEFKPLYSHIFDMCRNVEDIMGLFSEELREMDRNTVLYMVDEMQTTIDQQKSVIKEKDSVIKEKDGVIGRQKNAIEEKDTMIDDQKATIHHLTATAEKVQQENEKQRQELQEKDRLIQELQEKLACNSSGNKL